MNGKKLIALVLMAMLAIAMVIPAQAADTRTMYVYTENGKSLNVRSEDQVGDNIVGRLNYGAAVQVYSFYNGWALIDYNHGEYDRAYVQSRYLVDKKPTAGKSAKNANGETVKDAAKVLSDMNAEFKAGTKVTNTYSVYARPSRSTGWVNLRWGPSSSTERITTCPMGMELIVMAELKSWYQVEDPTTGMIGFISKEFVTK